MPTMKLTRAYLHNGVTYGPGVVDMPDDEAMLKRVGRFELANQAAIQDERRQLLNTLPVGHPMRSLIEESDENTSVDEAVAPLAVGAPQPNPNRPSDEPPPPSDD
jgi:hypothetical protein